MNIVGFNFTKISAERQKTVVGKISINNNVTLTGVTEAKFGMGSDRMAIKAAFSFRTNYQPDLATIALDGDVLILADKKQADEILDKWKKDKQLAKDVAQPVMNHALERCNIQALLLARDLGLPSPIPLPKVTVRDAKPAAKPAEPAKASKKK